MIEGNWFEQKYLKLTLINWIPGGLLAIETANAIFLEKFFLT